MNHINQPPRHQDTKRFWKNVFPLLLVSWCLGGYSASAATFRPALPGYAYAFPRDHGSHPAFRTEWWYFTGHLKATNGRRFGYQLTFFRNAMTPQLGPRRSKWAARDVIFAHLALTDERGGRFLFDDKLSRQALNLAGADKAGTPNPRVWIGPWALRFGGKNGEMQTMRASGQHDGQSFGLALTQRALKPPTIHGQAGVSQKSAGAGRASHYYSYCRLQTRGVVKIGGERFDVTGQSWFDHEFGSNQLSAGQTGWDWFSIQLGDGRELMLYQLRLQNGKIDPNSSGTLVERDGRARHLKRGEFRIEPLATWRNPRTGSRYPSRWKLTLPREGLSLDVTPTLPGQELDVRGTLGLSYWEGACRVIGSQNGQTLRGNAYVELTGYARAFNRTF